jgi:Tol biopolymer transport system component
VQFTLARPEDTNYPNGGTAPLATVSPDGRRVVFLAESVHDNVPHIWLQQLNEAQTATRLPGTAHGWGPFWSPDGRQLGFLQDRQIKILNVDSPSESRVLTDAPVDHGVSWGSRGDILMGVPAGHLESLPSNGGPRRVVTTVDRSIGERRHLWPQFLPDGRTFIYLADHETPANSVIMVGSLDSSRTMPLVSTPASALFDSREHLLYLTDDGTLLAQRLNVPLRRPIGKPAVVATGVA